jgi:type IV pilus assembly protein PilW
MRFQLGRQSGLTLVELMVALGISLVLILAASTLYLSTRATQKAVDERGQVFETGHAVMRTLGRDLSRAGFYPVIAEESVQPGQADSSGKRSTYIKTIQRITANAPPAGLAYGVFGCDGSQVAKTYAGCVAAASDAKLKLKADHSDGLLISYFTSDAFSLDVGDRADCTRADSANDTVYNQARVGTVTLNAGVKDKEKVVSRQGESAIGLAPASPILVINRYALRPMTYTTEGGAQVNTFELVCRGNGAAGGSATFASLITGIERLGIRYGVFSDVDARVPTRYLTADEVNALPDVVGHGNTFRPWQQVVSVEVCVMVRSFSRSDLLNSGVALTDCDGQPYKPDQAGVVVRKMVQVFGLRNRQSLDLENEL